MKDLINQLNKEQKMAVEKTDGAQLILAGAGSGKTRVVTTKIAYLIEEKNVLPSEILAFTFTNKAANEMKERLAAILNQNIDRLWIGTFHSICVRILRMNMNLSGYNNNFTIYDSSDQKVVVRDVIRASALDEKIYNPNYVHSRISQIKNEGLNPDQYLASVDNYMDENIGNLYKAYQDSLKGNNAFDFDDLILKTIELLNNDDQTRIFYQEKFKYVFVDEYQDTNNPQYELIKILTGKHNNLTVVGDADQSIYKWRGANINNILDFEKDFDNVTRINLNQNYRSSQHILDTANMLIENNISRYKNELWTDNEKGISPKLIETQDSISEAKFVVEDIKKSIDQGYSSKEIAILYRSNSISRTFEEELIKAQIPYRVVGGIKFYDRKEIKDLMAYLSLISNSDDDVSLKRIINSPKRGIGDTSIEKLETIAGDNGVSLFSALSLVEDSDLFDKRAKARLQEFKDMIDTLVLKATTTGILDLFDFLINTTEYVQVLEDEKTIESRSKIDNINELRSSIEIYSKEEGANLSDFLAQVSLLSDVDKTQDGDSLSLMTVHGAKGLEFDKVYIVALEDGIFPSAYAEEDEDIEEERRLMYVAITRARKELVLSYARRRILYGKSNHSRRSPFVDEIVSLLDASEPFGQAQLRRSTAKDHFNSRTQKYKYTSPRNLDTRNENKSKEYEIGQEVSHKKWGKGTIVKLDEIDGDTKISIVFDDVGLKELLKSFAPLTVIE